MTSSPVAFEDGACAQVLLNTPLDTIMILFTQALIRREEVIFFVALSESRGIIDVIIDITTVWNYLSSNIECKSSDMIRTALNHCDKIPTVVHQLFSSDSPVCTIN